MKETNIILRSPFAYVGKYQSMYTGNEATLYRVADGRYAICFHSLNDNIEYVRDRIEADAYLSACGFRHMSQFEG